MKVVCQNPKCKCTFDARPADVKRGWGKFCSKRCKAVEQEGRTHQYAKLLDGGSRLSARIEAKQDHPFSSDAIGQY